MIDQIVMIHSIQNHFLSPDNLDASRIQTQIAERGVFFEIFDNLVQNSLFFFFGTRGSKLLFGAFNRGRTTGGKYSGRYVLVHERSIGYYGIVADGYTWGNEHVICQFYALADGNVAIGDRVAVEDVFVRAVREDATSRTYGALLAQVDASRRIYGGVGEDMHLVVDDNLRPFTDVPCPDDGSLRDGYIVAD